MEKPFTSIALKPYTKKELAGLYQIDRRTLMRWLSRSPLTQTFSKDRLFTPQQVKTIFEVLGPPDVGSAF